MLHQGGVVMGGRDQTRVALRVILYENEVYRLSRSSSGVRVREGVAWVSFAGNDLIMHSGDELQIPPGRDFAVISSLSRTALVLEVLARGPAATGTFAQPNLRPVVLVRPADRPGALGDGFGGQLQR